MTLHHVGHVALLTAPDDHAEPNAADVHTQSSNDTPCGPSELVKDVASVFWKTWRLDDTFTAWRATLKQKRVIFSDDGGGTDEPERHILAGCACDEHRVCYEQGRALVTSAEVTVRRTASRGHDEEPGAIAELSCVYRHYFAPAKDDGADDEDEFVLACPYDGERLFTRHSEYRLVCSTSFPIPGLDDGDDDAIGEFRTHAFPRLFAQWKDAHATIVVCSVCHDICASGTASHTTSLCDACILCRQASMMFSPLPGDVTCCVCSDESRPMTTYDSTSLCGNNLHHLHRSCAAKMASNACPLCRGRRNEQ
jgi:hypothetical protein